MWYAKRKSAIPSRIGWVVALAVSAVASGGETKIIDVDLGGNAPLLTGVNPTYVSFDGRYVAFTSSQPGLVNGVLGGPPRVYLRDMVAGVTGCASLSSNGSVPMNGASYAGSISAGGRYTLVFSSAMLTPNAPSGFVEAAYLFDRVLNNIELVSLSSAGVGGRATFNPNVRGSMITPDGRYVVFSSLDPLTADAGTSTLVGRVYRRDRVTQQTILISPPPIGTVSLAHSWPAGISNDGQRVLYQVSIAGSSPSPGIYVRDLAAGVNERIDVDANSNPLNGIDFTGRGLDFTADGSRAIVESDAANPTISDFDTRLDVYVIDWLTGSIEIGSKQQSGAQTNSHCFNASISDDGRYLAFQTTGPDLVPWDQELDLALKSEVIVRDLVTQRNLIVNISTTGQQSTDLPSTDASISGDGKVVVFRGPAETLAPGFNGFHLFHRNRVGFTNLGYGKPGSSHAIPNFSGSGSTTPGGAGTLSLAFAAPFRPAVLFVSLDRSYAIPASGPLQATVFVPLNVLFAVPMTTDGFGSLALPYVLPSNVPLVPELYLQMAIADPLAIGGASVSNALLMGL